MTIFNLLTIFGISGILLTILTKYTSERINNLLITFLQYFCGVWFVFSGVVKAIDPMGTAFKMQQYFSEFEGTFEGVGFKNFAKIFPWFSEHAIGFSIFMILLEIVLGVLLILGSRVKFTKWTFFLIIFFFTILTGFTYLTGFVPSGENFFSFSKWAAYKETNMKVTDCGCFGDFLKLHPKVSFFKDLFLMLPAFLFLFQGNKFHKLFNRKWRTGIIALFTLGFGWFCYYNTYTNEPVVDFRPFTNGVNIRTQKAKEQDAQSAVKILTYVLKNRKTGEKKEISYTEYIDNKGYEKYTEDTWEIVDQVKSELTVPHTKISDFEVYDMDEQEATDDILNDKNYKFLVVSYKLDAQTTTEKTLQVPDSIFSTDTLIGNNGVQQIVKTFVKMGTKETKIKEIVWNTDFENKWKKGINTIINEADKAGIKAIGLVNLNGKGIVDDFRHATQSAYPFYQADELVIKTIMRSNPGLILMKDGQIIQKWHFNQLPSFAEIKAKFIK
jgi:uncharacterized membrane protein YphA (DoxX/SURF4 family)